MTSRTRDEAVPPAPEPEPTDLDGLYARQAPELVRLDGGSSALRAAADSHRRLAARRTPGTPVVSVRAPDPATPGGPVVEIVTDDMPFLVESVLTAAARFGAVATRVIHPIVVVRRDPDGRLDAVLASADPAAPPAGTLVESWIHLDLSADGEIQDSGDDAGAEGRIDLGGLERALDTVLSTVRQVVEDTTAMVAQAHGLSGALPAAPDDGPAQLLRWLADGHLTFLGYRRYPVTDGRIRTDDGSGLGLLRRAKDMPGFAPGADAVAEGRSPDDLIITRASASSPLRQIHPYYLAVTERDEAGRPVAVHRFLGTLTVPALYESVLDIPLIERRVRGAIARAGLPLDSYSGQRMLEVISGMPREELFGSGEQRLHDTAVGVLGMAGRRTVRLFLRPDPYHRFVSCLVFLPRDRYTTDARLAMAELLRRRLAGRDVEYAAKVAESGLAQVHFIVHLEPRAASTALATAVDDVSGAGLLSAADVEALQDELIAAVRTWDDRLRAGPEGAGVAALLTGVPAAYKAAVAPEHAAEDLLRVAALGGPGAFDVRLYPAREAETAGEYRFTLYLADDPVTLTAVLPLLQALGVDVLDERAAEFVRGDGLSCWVYDFGLRPDEATRAALADRAESEAESAFCAAFRAAWRGEADTDRFSALVLRAGLPWREVAVLRAYARYARQLGSPYTTQYMAMTLLAHPDIARALVALFHTRFDPSSTDALGRERATESAHADVAGLIDAVTGLDADRILRSYLAMIAATLRTNFYRDREFLSFKFDPSQLPDAPAPRPRFEIFVYAPRVEGVHLRFGAVARGGLRWSDRAQDYRTEVLGLVKAQAVKNAVIVPVGAKGGFVVRRDEQDPAEVAACYRMFVSGLLDVTDNLVDGATVAPPNVVRHDGDDSYLVVAADKGTAKFSDLANSVAAEYGFWLGDAFASGGSVGYDHKAMGITARGAWESVRHHFHELGLDTQAEEFTVVGIGDMSGDVFGNGMLLSPHIRLLAAFDHRHVFLDPDPDTEVSFAERARVFALPRSSWEDYDRSRISTGGGVWPRTAKSVPIGPEVRAALGLDADVVRLSPPDLMRAILRAPADLLWNGGIGTYVKAAAESQADAGDKANDAVRVDGEQLRVRVVGEGGNLGLTQRGRIEFARAGGKINTDAIDNSAGVDCSDHEVNIKILLDRLVVGGELTRPDRDALLEEMTDEVAELVLADNRDQNTVLGVARRHAPQMLGVHARLTADLVSRTGLVRKLEVLPDDAGFAALETAGLGLTSPELSTLLAHTKLDLTARVLGTGLPDAPAFAARLPEYFPTPLRRRFGAAIERHPLRREILTTMLVNEMVDGAGITYAFRLAEEMSADCGDAVRAYAVATVVFDLPALWRQLRTRDVPAAVSDAVVLESRRLLDRASRWLLTNRPQPLAVAATIARFAEPVQQLTAQLPQLLRGRELAAVTAAQAELGESGLGAACATRSAYMMYGYGLLDVVELIELSERDREPRDPTEVAALYYGLSEHLGVDVALTAVSGLERGDRWHALARLALRDDLYGSLRAITLDALREAAPGTSTAAAIELWEEANSSRLVRARSALQEIEAAGQFDLATLSVISRQLRGLAR